MSRFDYLRYDALASEAQKRFKEKFQVLEKWITDHGKLAQADSSDEDHANLTSMLRARDMALTSLEECYMWIGKLIRDEQLVRTHGQLELQEERKDS